MGRCPRLSRESAEKDSQNNDHEATVRDMADTAARRHGANLCALRVACQAESWQIGDDVRTVAGRNAEHKEPRPTWRIPGSSPIVQRPGHSAFTNTRQDRGAPNGQVLPIGCRSTRQPVSASGSCLRSCRRDPHRTRWECCQASARVPAGPRPCEQPPRSVGAALWPPARASLLGLQERGCLGVVDLLPSEVLVGGLPRRVRAPALANSARARASGASSNS